MKIKRRLFTISILTALLGFLVIAGWVFKIPVLESAFPGYVSMKLNTAICFIIAGFIFNLFLRNKYRIVYLTFSGILILVAVASIFEDISHYDLGIDEFWIRDNTFSIPGNPHPGRMSTTTAICFSLLGLSFFFLSSKTFKAIGQYLLQVVLLISFVAIVGYFFNVPTLYKLSFLSSMAVHTSIALFGFSIAVSLVNPQIGIIGLFSGDKFGNRMARRMFPQMITAVFVLGFLRIEAYKLHLVGVEFGIALYAISFTILGLYLIWDSALLLNKIDQQREKAERNLMSINANLENIVSRRTAELSESTLKSKVAEANLRAVFNSALVSIIEADMDGIITNFNRGAELQLGYKAEEVVNKQSPTFFHLEKEITERGDELTKRFGREIRGNDVFIEYAKHGTHESKKWTYLRKDGSMFPVQLVVSPITDDQGITTGFLGVATDISDLETAKSDLEVLATRLQKQNNQLLNFARITSHNLRSPVSNLNTILYLYKESEGDEKETLFEHFETVIHHLTETLDQLVDSLKIQEEPGRDSEWVNFEDIFNKTKQILAGAIIETHATVTADFSKADKIDYPKSYLESIMLNLLSNAMKYRSSKRIPAIHFQTEFKDGETIMKVNDNGLGIDMKKYGRSLFGLNNTFHDHAEAKGVGLYITKKQIEAMGGYISAESEVEKGTTFTVFFNKNKKNA